ncbi:restriction endonuclease subunit S [Brachybacterium sp. AOP42-E1-35]|uniref:restriction endonuclease subunit S n=1 Tax=Brachybacterium sp. AOP42-E1-35 TaxID=3457664 RepID=UPI00402ACE58
MREVVDRLPLGQVGTFVRGRRFTKKDLVSSGIPSIHYGEVYTSYGISATKAVSNVREALRPQLRFAQPGDVVIAAVGETAEDVGKGVAWLGDTPVAIHDDCFMYRSDALDPRYVAHYLQTEELIQEKHKYVARAKVKRISGANLGRLLIPVPPLDEQRHVVSTLEAYGAKLADLTESLKAEIEGRATQYEHYRGRLFRGGAA